MLSEAGVIAETEIRTVADHYGNVIIDRYVVMPNHVHAIIAIAGDHVYSPVETGLAPSPASAHGRSLSTIVGSYKAGVSRTCHAKGLSAFAWQVRFHDHVIRSNASLKRFETTSITTPRTGFWIPTILPPPPSAPKQMSSRDGARPVSDSGRIFSSRRSRAAPPPKTRQAASLQKISSTQTLPPLESPSVQRYSVYALAVSHLLYSLPATCAIATLAVQLKAVFGRAPQYVVFYYLTRPHLRR
jgi:hypothetical protein